MPRTKSGNKRKSKDDDEVANLRKAVESVLKGEQSLRMTANMYRVSKSSLSRHVRLHKLSGNENFSYTSSNAVWKVFSDDEEQELVEYLITASKMHYGLSTKQVKVLVYDFAKAKNKKFPNSWDVNKQAGKQFYSSFMLRHNDGLSLRKPEATSLSRSTSFNRHNVKMFFDKLKDVMIRYKFTADKIYNLDESGITTVHTPVRVVAPKGVKQVGSMTSGERGTTVTLIGCVNALGNTVPPMMIFPRVHFKEVMLNGAPTGTIGGANISGWSSNEKFIDYLKHFLRHVNPTKESPVLLILDNHDSHLSIEAIQLAKDSGIIMLTFPPHTSHKLKPLDRTVFGPFKSYFNTASCEWLLSSEGRPITIMQIASIAGKAYPRAFTPSNIQSGFRVAGIWPLDENIFSDDEFMSSLVTDRPLVLGDPVDKVNAQVTSPQVKEKIQVASTSTSPYDVRPLPKAAPRTTVKRGRKPGRCRIVTDTPEKNELEELAAKRRRKTPQIAKSCVKALVNKLKKPKRRTIVVSSSEEDIDDDVVNLSDLDVEPIIWDNDYVNLKSSSLFNDKEPVSIGDFYLIKVEGRKRILNFVVEVLESDGDNLAVKYLKRIGDTRTFVYDKDTRYDLKKSDIVKMIPKPVALLGTKRQCEQVKFDVDFEGYIIS